MQRRYGTGRILVLVGIGGVADFVAAFPLAAALALSLGTAFRLLLFMTGVLLFLIGLPSGTLPEGALYRNPPYHVPLRHERPTSREDIRDQAEARTRKPLGQESLAGLALLLVALVLSLLPL